MEVERTNHAWISEAREDTSIATPAHGPTNASPSQSFASQQQQAQQPLEKVLAMAKGDDKDSYSKNSEMQGRLNQIPQLALCDALERVALPSEASGPVVVADLGSSSGPNTIDNVAFIVDNLRQRMPKDAEFQTYFNDLPSNNFNNLFQLLTNDNRTKNFFAAGVAGSYYDRLFAQSSVHVFFSSNCIHRLSKVPDEVLDKNSPAYNTGHTWIYHSRSAVAKAYQQQALLDLKTFLLARAAELVSGGLLFFNCQGRTTTEPNEHGLNGYMRAFPQMDLDEVWSELIAEGLLTEKQRDNFNIPVYFRSMEDVRDAVAGCGSLYDVQTAKLQVVDYTLEDAFGTTEPTLLAKKFIGFWKALMNPLLEVHVGKKLKEVIWERYSKVLEKRIYTQDLRQLISSICIIGLIRK